MKTVFTVLSAVSVFSGILSIIVGLLDIAQLVSGIFAILSGYAWYLIGEMWEEHESMRIDLLRLKTETQTETK